VRGRHAASAAISSSAVRHLQTRWWLGLGLAIIAASVLSLSALSQTSEPSRFPGSTAVGVLLRGRRPFCTASVVPSVRGDLILTAAHCLGRRLPARLMFAPSYDDERAPFGEWHVTGQVFPHGWFPHRDINEDFAFLTVRGDVQARSGAERLGYSFPVPAWVRLEAYSLAGKLTVCSRRPGTIMAAGQLQLRFACPGYASASSGGPFLADVSARSGLGIIVGIIGGYQEGGETPLVSYSSPFGAVLHRLYAAMAGSQG
jgi:hypothetical protein